MIGRWAQRFATAIENPITAYGAALGAVAASAGLRGLFGLVMPDAPNFMAFFPAVLFATLVAGARGGLVATGASALIIWAIWLPRGGSAQIQLAMFVVTAAATVGIAKAIRLAIRRAAALEQRFKVFQEQALDAFVILEPVIEDGAIVDFTWTYANASADRLAPTGAQTLVGLRVRQAFPDETGMAMYRRFIAAYASPEPDSLEVRRVINGAERFLRSSAVRVADGLAVAFHDITDQRQSETALRAGQARVQAIMDALPQLIWSARPNGACNYFSPQWVNFTGVPAQDHQGDGWLQAIHPDDLDGVRAAWEQTVKGVLPFDIEYRLRRHDGVWRWFNAKASAVRGADGDIAGWFGASTDITEIVEARRDLEDRVAERTRALEASLEERARAEAALAQAQRLETVGRLTGGVAHDFNNLLTVVIGGLDMILKHPGDTDRVVRLGEAALAAGRRGERLTRQLLAFSRRQELKLEVLDVPALIDQIEPLVRRAVGEAVTLTVTRAADLGGSRLDPAQFEAALLNLVVNAADAVSDSGGAIEIATTRRALREGEVQGARAGDYICVSVADTGVGMSPATAERAFEPFFTTKEVGRGTGLGLAQVYGFIAQVGGAVSIRSEVGRGTTVSLFLPRAEGLAPVEVAAPPIDNTWARDTHILLVEDDAAVRAMTEGLLADLGCTVTAAPDGPSALARLQAGERFDLLLSDIVMPGGMSGVDLAQAASARDPDLPILLTTGYAGERVVEPEGLAWPVLRKPFRAEQLGAALRDALSGSILAA